MLCRMLDIFRERAKLLLLPAEEAADRLTAAGNLLLNKALD